MTVKEFLTKIFFIEIFKGLGLTFKHMVSPSVTRQYPEEKREPFPGSRGLHALVRDEETGKAKCVGCGLCAAFCPSQCIYIYTTESEDHKKIVERYEIDTLKCVFCALCVEACPYGAVALTEHFEYSDYTREAFYYTQERLLENWDTYMSGDKGKKYFEKFWRPKSEDIEYREASGAGETKGP
jgi:NADH-quinone oxidoreductase subunit I